MENRSVYQLVGGSATFEKLVEAFYRRVDEEPVLKTLYEEGSNDSAIHYLTLFLIQFFGGPSDYNEQRGHPRLKQRHQKFTIGIPERDAWVTLMIASVDEVGIEEPMRSLMNQYFKNTATFLINTPGESVNP